MDATCILRRCEELRNEAWRRSYCVITRLEGGVFVARAYSVRDHTGDFSETGSTELASLETVALRLNTIPTASPPTQRRNPSATENGAPCSQD